MFEVGFTEILLICGIALLVLGPERLPKLASDLGRWAGRARAMARQLRTQLEQEVQYDPLKEPSRPTTPTIHTPAPAAPAAPAAEPSHEVTVNPADTGAAPETAASAPEAAITLEATASTPAAAGGEDESKPA